MSDQNHEDLKFKYRPGKFGHLAQGLSDHVIGSTTDVLSQRQRIQAMLLTGPYGSGKTSMARLFGRRTACENKHLHPFEPCGRCEGCTWVHTYPCSAHFDGYREFNLQEQPANDVVKEVRRRVLYFRPINNTLFEHVIALDEFHCISIKQQEKFVKVIEKSSVNNTLFILCAPEGAQVSEPIADRCTIRRITLPSLAASLRHVRIIARAEGTRLDPQDAELHDSSEVLSAQITGKDENRGLKLLYGFQTLLHHRVGAVWIGYE